MENVRGEAGARKTRTCGFSKPAFLRPATDDGRCPQAMVGGRGLAGFQNGFSGEVPRNMFTRGFY